MRLSNTKVVDVFVCPSVQICQRPVHTHTPKVSVEIVERRKSKVGIYDTNLLPWLLVSWHSTFFTTLSTVGLSLGVGSGFIHEEMCDG